MGRVGILWYGKDIDKLKAIRSTLTDEEQIKAIDEVIAHLEEENDKE